MDLIKSYASKCCTGQKKIAYCVDCGKELIIYKRASSKTCRCDNCRKNHIRQRRLQYRLNFLNNDYEIHFGKKYSKESWLALHNGGCKGIQHQGDLRRSKNEIEFCKLCEEYFDNVKHNESIFNEWDADVIIEDIKFAVLWNGPWHYKVITSQKNLDAIKRRDQIKIKLIKKNGYIPYIIKDEDKSRAKDNNYVKEKFDEFLKYLKENTII